jgi:hypothetical protein
MALFYVLKMVEIQNQKNQLHHEYIFLSFQNNKFKFCFKVINVSLSC